MVYLGNARFEFADPEVRVGRDPSCALRLDALDIAPHHCTLLPRAAGCFVVEVGGKTRVNNLPITGPRALYRDDNLQLGDHTLFVEHLDGERDPVEQRLLLEIRRGDEAARLVYADWLDENADPRRAELLRVEDAIAAGPFADRERLVRRRRELSIVIDAEWRMQITRVPVERCDVRECRRDWSQLDETRDRGVRSCGECGGRVRFCENLAEAGGGGRVAIDGSIRRDFETEDTFDTRF